MLGTTSHSKIQKIAIIGVILLFCGVLIFSAYKVFTNFKDLKNSNTELKSSLQSTQDQLTELQKANNDLLSSLKDEADKSQSFSEHLNQVTEDYNKLQWLSTLDKQLLQKYSKVYFLNENYTPRLLSPIDTKYLSDQKRTLQIHDYVLPFLQKMLQDALQDGITINVASAYRSFKEQASLKSSYKMQYGSGANSFSAEQGYSEHQLGTTVDLTTPKIGGGLTGFEKTTAYTWLLNNAYKYGFVISYPKENAYYIFEPWHWRFVGLNLALKLHNDHTYFYNLDQRDIDTYLGTMFDNTPSNSQ